MTFIYWENFILKKFQLQVGVIKKIGISNWADHPFESSTHINYALHKILHNGKYLESMCNRFSHIFSHKHIASCCKCQCNLQFVDRKMWYTKGEFLIGRGRSSFSFADFEDLNDPTAQNWASKGYWSDPVPSFVRIQGQTPSDGSQSTGMHIAH